MLIAIDGHLHWYAQYQMDKAFNCLVRNLDRMTSKMRTEGQNVFKMAFLVEPANCHFFEQLRDKRIDCSMLNADVVPGNDGLSLSFVQQGICRLCLIAGKQIVTRERIEILGVPLMQTIPDNLPAQDVINCIVENNGIPVLPWAPGKWFFRRGRLVKELIDNSSPTELAVCDTSLRPILWPLPALMRRAGKKGLVFIAGSDPLPLPGEEKQMGSYGFVYNGPFDKEQPAHSVRQLLSSSPDAIIPAGRRNNILQVFHRLKNNIVKRRKEKM